MKFEPTQLDDTLLSRYLSWALDRDASAEACSPLFGGVHQKWRVTAQVGSGVCDYVLRQAPSQYISGFARQEVAPYKLSTEFAVLTELQQTEVIAPNVWGFDAEGEFFGAPVYLMEFIAGKTVFEVAQTQPETVVNGFVEAILTMNRVSPARVASVAKCNHGPIDLVSWLLEHSEGSGVPDCFRAGLKALGNAPSNRPLPAFGNGDLNPQNFIVRPDGSVAVVDWEYAGFNDPLAEIMLMHTWPPEAPFLHSYPVARVYCEQAGLDAGLLAWYELQAALTGWVYAAKNRRPDAMVRHEGWLNRLVA
jgi:aminoglycoside phosphotransferase (APT) family kinase protein